LLDLRNPSYLRGFRKSQSSVVGIPQPLTDSARHAIIQVLEDKDFL